jgi:hypothetical protein
MVSKYSMRYGSLEIWILYVSLESYPGTVVLVLCHPVVFISELISIITTDMNIVTYSGRTGRTAFVNVDYLPCSDVEPVCARCYCSTDSPNQVKDGFGCA